jgi:hypothetical protein
MGHKLVISTTTALKPANPLSEAEPRQHMAQFMAERDEILVELGVFRVVK